MFFLGTYKKKWPVRIMNIEINFISKICLLRLQESKFTISNIVVNRLIVQHTIDVWPVLLIFLKPDVKNIK